MQNIIAFLEAPLFNLWKSCLKALKFLSDSHSAFLGRKTRMTQLVSKHSHENAAPKANWKEYPFYEKSCIFVVVKAWKISAAQIMRAEKFRLSNFGCGKVSILCRNIYPWFQHDLSTLKGLKMHLVSGLGVSAPAWNVADTRVCIISRGGWNARNRLKVHF